jgi:hypothetical protein
MPRAAPLRRKMTGGEPLEWVEAALAGLSSGATSDAGATHVAPPYCEDVDRLACKSSIDNARQTS